MSSKFAFLTTHELQGLADALEDAISSSHAAESDYGFMLSQETKSKMHSQRVLWHRLQVEVNDKLEDRKCTR